MPVHFACLSLYRWLGVSDSGLMRRSCLFILLGAFSAAAASLSFVGLLASGCRELALRTDCHDGSVRWSLYWLATCAVVGSAAMTQASYTT